MLITSAIGFNLKWRLTKKTGEDRRGEVRRGEDKRRKERRGKVRIKAEERRGEGKRRMERRGKERSLSRIGEESRGGVERRG